MRVRSVKSAVGNVESVDVELVAADHRGSVVAVLLRAMRASSPAISARLTRMPCSALGTSPADGVADECRRQVGGA